MNIVDVLNLKFPNSLKNGLIVLQDDGQGPYIKLWNVEGISKPTQQQLSQWAIDLEQDYTFSQNRMTNQPIYDKLDDLDIKSIRALRTNDTIRLAALEQEAVALRSQLLPTQ